MSSRLTDPAVLPMLRASSAIDLDSSPGQLEEEIVALFDQFRMPLLRYLSSFGLARPDCEEVLQEVFLSLFRHLRRGKSRANLRGWLFRVAHNLGLKRRVQARRDLDARADAAHGELVVDIGPSPEDQLVNSQSQKRLRAVVRALPETDRRCLFLRAEGLRYREIAQILEMSLGAISLSLARSLERIARAAER
jgi:RNA polymerase sigma-70 factor (ECF subfamily)